MAKILNYGQLMHRAMQRLIADILTHVAHHGLEGDHHFYITFDTTHPDVAIADWLRDRYPDEMMIVMQNWFDALEVRQDDFSVTLNFGNSPEPLVIPYDAIKTFADPSVEFGLRFDALDEEDGDTSVNESPMIELDDTEPEAPEGDAEVVSLDSFRKR